MWLAAVHFPSGCAVGAVLLLVMLAVVMGRQTSPPNGTTRGPRVMWPPMTKWRGARQ